MKKNQEIEKKEEGITSSQPLVDENELVQEENVSSNKNYMIFIGLALLLIVGGLFLYSKKGTEAKDKTTEAKTQKFTDFEMRWPTTQEAVVATLTAVTAVAISKVPLVQRAGVRVWNYCKSWRGTVQQP